MSLLAVAVTSSPSFLCPRTVTAIVIGLTLLPLLLSHRHSHHHRRVVAVGSTLSQSLHRCCIVAEASLPRCCCRSHHHHHITAVTITIASPQSPSLLHHHRWVDAVAVAVSLLHRRQGINAVTVAFAAASSLLLPRHRCCGRFVIVASSLLCYGIVTEVSLLRLPSPSRRHRSRHRRRIVAAIRCLLRS